MLEKSPREPCGEQGREGVSLEPPLFTFRGTAAHLRGHLGRPSPSPHQAHHPRELSAVISQGPRELATSCWALAPEVGADVRTLPEPAPGVLPSSPGSPHLRLTHGLSLVPEPPAQPDCRAAGAQAHGEKQGAGVCWALQRGSAKVLGSPAWGQRAGDPVSG